MGQQNIPSEIILHNPYDAHVHWRQGELLTKVAAYTRKQFSGATLMPNTDPKIITSKDLDWYIDEVEKEIGDEKFFPAFTLYLSEDTNHKTLESAWFEKKINAVKYYPQGGTTSSERGLVGFEKVHRILECMEQHGIPLLIHGETPQEEGIVVDDFKRENLFLEEELAELVETFPKLKIVLEHITTEAAATFVLDHENLRATITPQHCLFDSRALFNGMIIRNRRREYTLTKNGIHPSMMCRPILKDEDQLRGIQKALRRQAKWGLKKFGLGTDTAPHVAEKKYCECGACGVFSAPIALELYAMAFEEIGILDHLQVFAGEVIPEFYGIKELLPSKTVTLSPIDQSVPEDYHSIRTPFSGMTIPWTVSVR